MSGKPVTDKITVEVLSDVVCPWCYIGKRKLEAAAASFPDLDVEMRWRPFQLDATVPPGGLDRRAYMERKFGPGRLDEIHARLAAAGREVGLDFAFDKIEKRPNTFDAHRLIRQATLAGLGSAMAERLFKAYFVDGLDVGDRVVLIDLGREVGLDRGALEQLFAAADDIPAVEAELATIRDLGVSGVPFYIFTEEVYLSGAQPAEVFAAALTQARASGPRP